MVIVLHDIDLRYVLQVSLTHSFLNWSLFFCKMAFYILSQFIFILEKSENTDKRNQLETPQIPPM